MNNSHLQNEMNKEKMDSFRNFGIHYSVMLLKIISQNPNGLAKVMKMPGYGELFCTSGDMTGRLFLVFKYVIA